MVASKKKKAGKGKGSKAKAKKEVREKGVEEVQNLLTPSVPPAPEPQALPPGEVTDPQVSETKGG